MPYQREAGKPVVECSMDALERGLAKLCAQRDWSTNQQFNAGVDALTDPQVAEVMRDLLKDLVKVRRGGDVRT